MTLKIKMAVKNYNFPDLERALFIGQEATFAAIGEMIRSMQEGETYHHFYGYADQRWESSGLADRARDKIVPLKIAQGLRTQGLYYPADWILKKFGGEIAKKEFRDYTLLPEDLEIFSRFYVYGNTVLHIFETEDSYSSLRIHAAEYAQAHRELFGKMTKGIPSSSGDEIEIFVQYPDKTVMGIADYVLLDCLFDGIKGIRVHDKKIKKRMEQILSRSKGLEVILK